MPGSAASENDLLGALRIMPGLAAAGLTPAQIAAALIANHVYPGLSALALLDVLMAADRSTDRNTLDQALTSTDRFAAPDIAVALTLRCPQPGSELRVIWSSGQQQLNRCRPDGTSVNQIGPFLVTETLAADLVHGMLYYTTQGEELWIDGPRAGVIGRMTFDGWQNEAVVTGPLYLGGLAVDPVNGFLFWTHGRWPSYAVQRSDLRGTQVVDLATSAYGLSGVGVNPVTQTVFWTGTNDNFTWFLRSARYDGSDVATLASVTGRLWSPVPDPSGQYVYAAGLAGVLRVSRAEEPMEVVAPPLPDSFMGALTLAPRADLIVWTETAAIRSARGDGSDAAVIRARPDGPGAIAVVPVLPARLAPPGAPGIISIAAAGESGARGVGIWAVTADGQLWTLSQAAPVAGWSSWAGPGFNGQPRAMTLAAAGQLKGGNALLASLDQDGHMWVTAQQSPSGDWAAWSGLGSRAQHGPFTALAVTDTVQGEAYIWGISHGLLWRLRGASGWERFQWQAGPMKHIAAAQPEDGPVLVGTLDQDGQLWTVFQRGSGDTWTAWQGHGAAGHQAPFTDLMVSGRGATRGIAIWGITADGQLWTMRQLTAGGAWSDWEGPGFQGQPQAMTRVVAAQHDGGSVVLGCLDQDGLLWTISQQWPGGDWGDWTQHLAIPS